MRVFPTSFVALRLVCVLAAAIALSAGFVSSPAHAQIVVLVNGSPITNYDIEQRTKLIRIASQKAPSREQVIDELISDRLKLSDAKRYRLEISNEDVDNAFENLAKNSRTTPENFARSLSNAGINPKTLKARLKADLAWGQIIRGKFQSSLQVGEKEVFTLLERRNKDDEIGYEYTLTPILFVAPRGAPDSVIADRKREAEQLRARFQNCEAGIPFARALRDVVVRDTIRKGSAELSPALRKVLNSIEVGTLAPPEITPGGVEVVALCGKKETDDSPAKRAAREQMYSDRFKAKAERYLEELRKSAMIEYRNR